ncbi:hypothetical protein H7X64_03890 [Armatimonadetes bacterium]|nr:hypothetical protein [bacterium]
MKIRDNSAHLFSLSSNIEPIIVTDFQNEVFYMNDTTKVDVESVAVMNSRKFEVFCSENVCDTLVEGIRNTDNIKPTSLAINNHFTIDGKQLFLIKNPNSPATLAEKNFAQQNNLILLKHLYVEGYDSANSIDYRNRIYIELDDSESLSQGAHNLSVTGIGDCAANTDQKNLLLSDSLAFQVVADIQAPTVNVVVMSPEQWLVKFSEPVICNSKDWIELNLGDIEKTELINGVDYVVTEVSNKDSLKTEFLIKFTNDWTVYFDGKDQSSNYWDSAQNPYKVTFNGKYIYDHWGNQLLNTQVPITLLQDTSAPYILSVTKTQSNYETSFSGQQIKLIWNEPIQFFGENDWETQLDFTPRIMGSTQEELLSPTFIFTQGSKNVAGHIKRSSMNTLDTSFVIVPTESLETGEWTLICSNVIDDAGNMVSATPIKLSIVN